MKTCPTCNEPFTIGRRSTQEYCSERCRKRAEASRRNRRHPHVYQPKPPRVTEKNCEYCGIQLVPKRYGFIPRFCSTVCTYQSELARGRADHQAQMTSRPCRQCQTPFIPPHVKSTIYCSAVCRETATKNRIASELNDRQCTVCQTPLHGKQETYCSKRCLGIAIHARAAVTDGPSRHIGQTFAHVCRICQGAFLGGNNARYCSVVCRTVASRSRSNERRQIVGGSSERLRQSIYERDNWTCRLCGQTVDPDRRGPDPLCASLDHIVPLALGGVHQASHLQLAHYRCHSQKGGRTRREVNRR